jgi:hypothetical protein
LAALSLESVIVRPSLLRDEETLAGRHALRDWVSKLANTPPIGARLRSSRVHPPRTVLAAGEVTVDGSPVSPLSMVITLREGLVATVVCYLSDPDLLHSLGYL